MPTQPYRNAAGQRIPSVTTILSRYKESGGLIHWAWQQGRDGLDYRETKDRAADAGTLAHAMVEADIKGTKYPLQRDYPDDIWTAALSSFEAFKSWSAQTRLTPCESEVSLTCECHQFGGTLDAMLINDQLAMGDWKTSNAIYSDYLCQLAAYGHLWTVNFPDRPITGGYHILRFSKVGGAFAHHFWPDLSVAWRSFELMRELYNLDKHLKELV